MWPWCGAAVWLCCAAPLSLCRARGDGCCPDTQTDEVNALRKVINFEPEEPDDATVAYESEVGQACSPACARLRGGGPNACVRFAGHTRPVVIVFPWARSSSRKRACGCCCSWVRAYFTQPEEEDVLPPAPPEEEAKSPKSKAKSPARAKSPTRK